MNQAQLLIRESIRATMARYCVSADSANYLELSQCFSPQGVLAVTGGLVLAGPEAIAAELGRRAQARGHGIRTDVFQRHFIGTSHIVIEGDDAAQATTYYMVVTEQGPDHAGRYLDRFCPCGREWLLLSREASMDWVNPLSRFAPLAAATRST